MVPNKADCTIKAPLPSYKKLASYVPRGRRVSCEDAGDGLVHIAVTAKARTVRGPTGRQRRGGADRLPGTLPLCAGEISQGIYDIASKIGVYVHGEPLGLDVSDQSGG